MKPTEVEGETAAMSEPTDKFPVTAHEWLQDALGRYQVTHIHSSIREALRAMDLTEEDKEIIAPKPSTAAKEEIALLCKYCGDLADHRCGNFHACGDCCGNHGELRGLDKRLYEWVTKISKSHGAALTEIVRLTSQPERKSE